ncbi:MAG: TraM recognition domain-containing protein [Planctomycetaceae bacterium]|nr:TraM recognition domain-containing protein [Planctomycetaceae bacterium]
MMRDAYYQSVGNPVQLDRLPGTRPGLELLPLPLARTEALRQVALALSGMGALATLTLLLDRPTGIDWLEPYDWAFAIPTLVIGIALACHHQRLDPLLHPAVLFALVLVTINHRTPWTAQAGLFAGVAALLVYSLGLHGVALQTTAPVPRAVAQTIRATSQPQLLLLSAALGALLAWMLIGDSPLAKLALITLPLAAGGMPAPQALITSRLAIVVRVVESWLIYHAQPLPGLWQSPAGTVEKRISLWLAASVLTAVMLVRWPTSPLPAVLQAGQVRHAAWQQQLAAQGADASAKARYGILTGGVSLLSVLAIPVLGVIALAVAGSMPVLLDAAAARDAALAAQDAGEASAPENSVLSDLRTATDRTERGSLYFGRVVADGSPVLVPRDILKEHAHGLGDSGGGKTALFLCPTIEQLVSFGDCSVIVLDLKGDSLELLASLQAAAEQARQTHARALPLKFFSNQRDKTTFAFNPMTQPFWSNFDLLTQTDILCAANGLTYGTDYGAGYFSSANAAILFHTLKTFPHVNTFGELADCIGTVITVAKKRDLHPEIRKAGVHVQEVIKRLAACEALNVTRTTGHPTPAVDQAIDLTQLFQEPQLLYCHLPSTLSPSGAPEVARLFTYMLLAASTQTERRCPVFLVIDEFQRMVANNLEYMLQLARSMGVGIILANQSMQDLQKANTNLIPAIEANCRLRQWFSVSSSEDQERLVRSSGLTVDLSSSWSQSTNGEGKTSSSHSQSEQVVPRLTINDILLTNDHPLRSILRISRGAGYAQYGGLPVIVETNYHVTEAEYRRRKALPWPTAEGAFTPHRGGSGIAPAADAVSRPPTKATGPEWSEEFIGEPPAAPLTSATEQSLTELFETLAHELPPTNPPARRGKRP